MTDTITVTDVREAAHSVVHDPTSLRTSRFVDPWPMDPTRRLEYQHHRERRRQYTHHEHGNPANLVGFVLHALGLPMPPAKRNSNRFSKNLHPGYDVLSGGAESELQRMWDADVDGQHWTSIVS